MSATLSRLPTVTLSNSYFSGFWSTDGSDLFIRTSDKMELKVHKVILEMASEVFESMIFLASSQTSRHRSAADSQKGGLPLITVEDDSATFCALMNHIYRVVRFPISDEKKFSSVLDLAYKYKVKMVIQDLKDQLFQSGWITTTHPILMYILAIRHNMYDVMKEVYPRILSLDLTTQNMSQRLTNDERCRESG
ncbi:hypothetical protein SISNIDRAFT_519294 [Sistotremastrum niveocremeum HHB9708]|uniref:BTB domain-containing protein n=1 Tax=Sistotremastrum niveocremeum HHB9708 TaxID=1314777 RepID=A0A164RKY1_9AGAM|nr:hypothetical protein SISNIDRAFT_519294 [Sistotremastrum niveocremeum HHB9708]